MPEISIVVPVYKTREEYLRKCMDSLINQGFKNIEIIAVDDGSPDGCGKIIDEYAGACDKVVAIHKKNGGVSSARNAGIAAASGEYITFVDADDFLEPDTCEILHGEVQASKPDILIFALKVLKNGICENNPFFNCEREELSGSDELIIQVLCKESGSFVPKHNGIGCNACKLYKAELIKNNPYDESISKYEDTVFCLEVFMKAKKIIYINSFLYIYRKNNQGSAMNRFFEGTGRNMICVIERMSALCINNEAFEAALARRTFSAILESMKSEFLHRKNKKSRKIRFAEFEQFIKNPVIEKPLSHIDAECYGKRRKKQLMLLKNKKYRKFFNSMAVEFTLRQIKKHLCAVCTVSVDKTV